MKKVRIGGKWVGEGEPVYFIADIASNFDGELERAKRLCKLARDAGANAAKFQSFLAPNIVSRPGFENIGKGSSFQSQWDKAVCDVYTGAEFPRAWHTDIADYCREIGIDFFSTPYDLEAVSLLESLNAPAYKIGSGDINWPELLQSVAGKGKPVILGTGASTLGEIEQAVTTIRGSGCEDIILLQCVTNYPAHFENANIRAMDTLRSAFNVNVGYSDHTPGNIVPLGAVARGACMIEKHFTDDKARTGPDHPFAMDPADFKEMVDSVRILEQALGSSQKSVTAEEAETRVLQRRCLRAARPIPAGTIITEDAVITLRPAPENGLPPGCKELILGRKSTVDIPEGELISWVSM